MRYVQSTSCLMFAQRWSSQAPEAWRSGRWIHRVHHRFNGSLPLPRPHAGMCARRRSIFLLRRQEKDTKEKATPLSVTPSGQPAVRASGGVRANSLHCVALKQRAALIRLKLCSSARTEGKGSRTALRAIAALGHDSVAQAGGRITNSAGIGGAVPLSDHDFAQRNSCSDPNPGTVGAARVLCQCMLAAVHCRRDDGRLLSAKSVRKPVLNS